jgi:hypothetical protein
VHFARAPLVTGNSIDFAWVNSQHTRLGTAYPLSAPEAGTEASAKPSAAGQQRPHIANSRTQIAPTARVSVAARDSVYFQSYRATAQGWTLLVATELIWIKHGSAVVRARCPLRVPRRHWPATRLGLLCPQERTSATADAMSALGQKRSFRLWTSGWCYCRAADSQ